MAYTDAQGTNNSIRSNKTYSDLNLNFTKNPATNDVARLTDVEAVKRSVRNLILTNQLEDRIKEVINNFEPRADISSVQVFDEIDNNRYRVVINFYVLSATEETTITEFLERLR